MRVGTKIKYTKSGILGWEDIDEAEQAGLTLGQIVTVIEYDHEDNSIRIKESLCDTWMSAEHFESPLFTINYN